MRTAPRRTAIGNVRPGSAVGQVFTVERDGLRRVDVAVDAHTEQPPGEVEPVLRADGPQGPELRRARDAGSLAFSRGVPYVVKRGDTLSGIARRHGCPSAQSLAKHNDIPAPRYPIWPNQTLMLLGCSG